MDRGGPAQVLCEDCRLVETAVTIGIHEPPDLSMMFLAVVIIHFDDEEGAVFVERQRDGIGHQRFGGDEFKAKSFVELEGAQRIPRSYRWEPGQVLWVRDALLGRMQGSNKQECRNEHFSHVVILQRLAHSATDSGEDAG